MIAEDGADPKAEVLVLDSSVGVKWLRDEAGSSQARDLIARHAAGEVRLVVPVIFIHEVLDVARRHHGVEFARTLWRRIVGAEIVRVGIDDALVMLMLETCERLGCTFYDAAAPALAEAANARLVSADARAHAAVPGVMLVG